MNYIFYTGTDDQRRENIGVLDIKANARSQKAYQVSILKRTIITINAIYRVPIS